MIRLNKIANVVQGLSTFGRGAGARPGPWLLHIVENNDILDTCWLNPDGLGVLGVEQTIRTERHLLKPYDVLVTARAGNVNAALVPDTVSRTVASVTLLVVRPDEPGSGMGHFIWYFLSSTFGQVQLNKLLTVNATVISLSASNLGEVELPEPSQRELDHIVRMVNVSDEAYKLAIEAARLRQDAVRDSIIGRIGSTIRPNSQEFP